MEQPNAQRFGGSSRPGNLTPAGNDQLTPRQTIGGSRLSPVAQAERLAARGILNGHVRVNDAASPQADPVSVILVVTWARSHFAAHDYERPSTRRLRAAAQCADTQGAGAVTQVIAIVGVSVVFRPFMMTKFQF